MKRCMLVRVWMCVCFFGVCLVTLFDAISSFLGYLMPKPSL